MIQNNMATKPEAKAFLNRHEAFFGPRALKDKRYLAWAVATLESEPYASVTDEWSDRLLPVMAATLRQHYALQRLGEDAATADKRMAGQDWYAFLLPYADDMDAYAESKGIVTAPLLGFEVRDGASVAETELAKAIGAVLGIRAQWSLRAELACWPAWRRDEVYEGAKGMAATLGKPVDAAVVLMEFEGLHEPGPHDLFRILIRHHAGLPDPKGTDAAGTVKCAEVRRVLAGLGLIPQPEEDAATALALALPQTRDTLEWMAASLDGWLAEDPSRAKTPGKFPMRVPMRAAVATDMVDMGFATRQQAGLRLTALGMEACRLAVVPANPEAGA